ncbi:uncharacterized protein LOC130123085 [Lampris incognitus]|uniref:uncharacterized protein LOC130123085 n=1 Tax=Lampris incognitus TaxID=2546036 RepID=UPI0024B5259C|nr:uncharacterized protein LOC130123085 [Lampris incognitus]
MATHLFSILLILLSLTGIDNIITVTEVSVKAGSSISIPCLYDQRYRNHKKYLCKGYYWNTCSYEIKTNQRNSKMYSISDNMTQLLFSVTIQVIAQDTGDYWCAVEIDGAKDVGAYFHLSVSKDLPKLYVNNQTVKGSGDVKVTCNHSDRIGAGMRWCRLGGPCVTKSGSIGGAAVTVNPVKNAFVVIMKNLTKKNSGWYWCERGGLQMPVNLFVHEKSTTIPTNDILTSDERQQSRLTHWEVLIIILSVLVFAVLMSLLLWRTFLKRQKPGKEKSDKTVRSNSQNEGDLVYSTVVPKQKGSVQKNQESDDSATCTTAVIKQKAQQKVCKESESVIYSSVGHLQIDS